MKLKLTPESTKRYLAKIEYINFNAYELLSPWQRRFMASIADQISKDPSLSKKQIDQLDYIFEVSSRQYC